MYLCEHANIGNYNFYQIKSKHKDRCCIFIFVLIGFAPKLKKFKTHFENAFKKSWKKGIPLLPPSLPLFDLFA